MEDAGRAFVADLERGETAPAPRDGVISEPVMSAGGETAPPDSDRGEHRTHNVTGRRSTRRHRSQSTPANGDSCSTEKSVPPASRPASRAGERRGRKGVCGRDMCGITFPLVDGARVDCSSCGRMHDPTSRLCAACHRPGPGVIIRWRHIGPERVPEARQFPQACVDGHNERPAELGALGQWELWWGDVSAPRGEIGGGSIRCGSSYHRSQLWRWRARGTERGRV